MAYNDRSLAENLANSLAEQNNEAYDRALTAARDASPGWRIIETFGGFYAVPAGAELIQSTELDGLVLKLRQRKDASQ